MRQLKVLREEELENKVCVVVGTRPGIIKFSPIIRELEKRKQNFFIIHTGQHYSYSMDKVFFDELELPEPKYKLLSVAKSRFHGIQTARMLSGLETALLKEKPRVVLVGGDANTNLAGALAARKLHICVGHIEAGLRSDDWRMPEEHNRVMIDHISDLLFAPTEEAERNLIEDKVKGKVFVAGNTIVDAVSQNLVLAKRKSRVMEKLSLQPEKYFLLTLHREETVDFRENLKNVFRGIKLVAETFGSDIIFPAHPRTMRRIEYFKFGSLVSEIKNLRLIDAVGYLDFLRLLNDARLVLTDSGGIQEEGCILRVPCVTLRENTERPETVAVGANYVAGVSSPVGILRGVETMLTREQGWPNPFGDNASAKIIDVIQNKMG